MKKTASILFIAMALIITLPFSYAAEKKSKTTVKVNRDKYFGNGLCNTPGYSCVKLQKGDNWKKLWPDETQRDIVQRVNRTNMGIWSGRTIAVPENLENITLLDVAPFPKQIDPSNNKMIIVDQDKLAWGAYARDGALVKWGPISSGKNYCKDIGRSCITISGEFYVFVKKGKRCRSNIFPVGRGGSKMPYCMFFYRGYALHGSYEVPGYRASHGCVRLFTRDAKWLNLKFVELPSEENNFLGTKVVVQKLTTLKQ